MRVCSSTYYESGQRRTWNVTISVILDKLVFWWLKDVLVPFYIFLEKRSKIISFWRREPPYLDKFKEKRSFRCCQIRVHALRLQKIKLLPVRCLVIIHLSAYCIYSKFFLLYVVYEMNWSGSANFFLSAASWAIGSSMKLVNEK